MTAAFELDDTVDQSPSSEERSRPVRPGAVELAAAILLVGGVLGTVSGLARLADAAAQAPSLGLVTLVLNAAQVALGLLIRHGRLWLVTVNFVAVLGFLDLIASGANVTALMLGVGEVAVVIILLATKPWFDAIGRWRREAATRTPDRIA